MEALANGQLDSGDIKLAETAIIEKIDKTGDVPRLVETVTITKTEGQIADVHVVKH